MKKLFPEHKKTNRNNGSSTWKLVYKGFKPSQESLREALCTLGNGYFATRGAASESRASRIHYPGTYLAGVYNKLATHIAGRTVLNEDLVNCPNWLLLTFSFDRREWIEPSAGKILFYHQELDMRKGILLRKVHFQNRRGYRVRIETQRIVHMEHPHIAAIKYVITSENYTGWLYIKSALDGGVKNTGVERYRKLNNQHLKLVSLGGFGKNDTYLTVKTSQSKIKIFQAARVRIFDQDKEMEPRGRVTAGKKVISQEFKIFVRRGKSYQIEKTAAIYTSKDKDTDNHRLAAVNAVKRAPGFKLLLKEHTGAWEKLWKKFDIRIQGDPFSQRVLRLHIFHLLQTASRHNIILDAGFPARGLHGEAYRGHVFWDKLFVMNFFTLHSPPVAKALLLYRYRRLGRARIHARKNGYRGAMFPWQSGSKGDEETQLTHLNPMSGKWGPDYSRFQRHISFALGYNIWHYWLETGNKDFFYRYGAELFLSIAQFGASLSKYSRKDGRYHTEGIVGPDEFHEKYPHSVKPGLKDNAYTNLLIVWILVKARQILNLLPPQRKKQLMKKIKLTAKELGRWEDISRKMNIVIDNSGIISQFDGYFKLKELDWKAYRKKYGKIQRLDRILKAEGKSPNEYKAAKQADVLMIFYLLRIEEAKDLFNRLGYKFNREALKKNYEYYIKRTSHGSSLSKVVYCYLAFLTGKLDESWHWFLEVLRSDIYDTQGGTTSEGIHAGVMGGSIDIVIRAFAGIDIKEDRIKISPNLPRNWRGIRLKVCYKERWLTLFISAHWVKISILKTIKKMDKVPIEIYGKLYKLSAGKIHKIYLGRPARIKTWKGILKMAQERILIVDGDITYSEMLKTKLEESGYLADCVHRGREALEALKNKWFDLVVMDVVFRGEMSGFQLLQEIKGEEKLADIPVIVHSSKKAMKKTFEGLSAEKFFVKPYSINMLLNELKKILAAKK